MMTVLAIVVIVWLSLWLIVPLIEKHVKPMAPEKMAKISRFLPWLVLTSIVLALFKQMGYL